MFLLPAGNYLLQPAEGGGHCLLLLAGRFPYACCCINTCEPASLGATGRNICAIVGPAPVVLSRAVLQLPGSDSETARRMGRPHMLTMDSGTQINVSCN